MTATPPIIPKCTLAPLFDFNSSFQGTYSLGANVVLRETDHLQIMEAMNGYLQTLRAGVRESFNTYLSPHERDEFGAARLCLDHQFEAPDYIGRDEQRSREEIQNVVMAMRVVKPTLVKPGLYLGWERRNQGWELRGFEKVGFDAYDAPEEPMEDFSGADLDRLAEILPRIRQAYATHGQGSFSRVANALNFFEMGYRSQMAEVRFVLFTTALESLFVTSDYRVGLQFRERISRFLVQDPIVRQHLLETCQSIYGTRSKIVHGQAVGGSTDTAGPLMLELQEIGRRCLQLILRSDTLFAHFCGTPSQLERYFRGLP